MNNQSKTLIILSPTFPAKETENVMTAPENLILSLNKTHPEIKIIILSFHFPSNTREYKWHGNQVLSFDGKMKGGIYSLFLWIKVWLKLRTIKKSTQILGLFSFFCSESAFIGQYFSRLYRLKHFIWILGQDAKKENKQVRRIRPKPENLVAISDFISETFYHNHKIKPAHVITSGVIPSQFHPAISDRTIDILGAGSLIPLKQYDVFLEVINALKTPFPKLKAKLIGNGSEETKLKAKLQQLDLQAFVSAEGLKLSHSETLTEMQKSKLFLHPSMYEGFSTVCLEAVYAGCHVISFCKPMKIDITHWHIVKNREEMISKAHEVLAGIETEYTRVQTYLMDDSAKKIIQLYKL